MKYRHRHGERDELYYRLERSDGVKTIGMRIGIIVLVLLFLPFFVNLVGRHTGALIECSWCKDYVPAKQIKKIDNVNFELLNFCPECYKFCVNVLEKEQGSDSNSFYAEDSN